MSVSFGVLRTRFLDDTRGGGPGAAPALSRALDAIGWRAIREPTPDELAAHLLFLLDACVHEHRDTDTLAHGIATALRDAGPLLDGGLPPIDAYLPAATALLEYYIRDDGAFNAAVDWSRMLAAE